MGHWKFVQRLGLMLAFMAPLSAVATTAIQGAPPTSAVATSAAGPANPGLDEKIRSLEKTVEALTLKVEQAPPWWLPVAVSAALAAVLAYLVGHLTARRERSLAMMNRKFTRQELPEFELQLHENLSKHEKELAHARSLAESALTTYLLAPSSELSPTAAMTFEQEPWVKALTSMELSPSPLQPPKSGGRLTWKLEGMLTEYRNTVTNLNVLLRRFSVSSRIKSWVAQPDGDAVATYRQHRLKEADFRFSSDVVDMPEFQRQIRDWKSAIDSNADTIRRLQIALRHELENIKKVALEA